MLNLLEHARQNSRQGIALSNQKILVQFFRLVRILQFKYLIHIQAFQIQLNRISQNLRLKLTALVSENSGMARQIVVYFHESERSKPIEPGIGHFFHHLFKSIRLNLFYQSFTLILLSLSQKPAADAVSILRRGLLLCNLILLCLLCDTRNQFITRPHRIFLNRILVHDWLSFT